MKWARYLFCAPTGQKLAIFNGQALQLGFVPLPGGATAHYQSWGLGFYRHADWLGSSRLATSTSSVVQQDTAYAPFGEPYAAMSGGNGDYSFTGQNKDTDWLQYDFLFRQYDPRQSRWLSPDPAGVGAVDPRDPQTWNRYAYVRNSPLNNTDPQGLDCDDFGCDDGGFGWGDFSGDFVPCAGSGGGAILPGLLPNFITPNQGIDLQTLFFGPLCSTVQDCTMNAVRHSSL